MGNTILEVKDLKTYFYTADGIIKAVDGVSFTLEEGKILGIVGESGCGKSVTSMSIMRLVDPPGDITGGEIQFDGKQLLKLHQKEMRSIRGNDISMIFQEPMTSLNPVFKIGEQIIEVLVLHQGMDKKEAKEKTVEMLRLVKIPRADEIMNDYPHQLSGGMRQRVMIAMALACNPKLLIADEPTTALDVTIQAQILELMQDLKKKFNTAIMLITHNLGVIAEMADYVMVMYSGKAVENAPIQELFENPLHPYTRGLLNSIPNLHTETHRLDSIEGNVPNPLHLPKGCYFYPRCKYATKVCRQQQPIPKEVTPGHKVSCFRWEEVRNGKTS